ncbi:MAG: DHH family phosphoesterase [Clostridia bacterium]|nr:DHH family phosphoesterase [Clostridia bacterium]
MKHWQKTLLLLLALAVAVAGGFLAGQCESASRTQAERDLNILLNRSDLEGLGEIDGPIYVTGHKSPDSDTVGSAIACAALLRQLGYDAHPVVLGELNNETKFILESAGMEAPERLEDASGCNMILVDHSEYTQSAEGLRDARIISIITATGPSPPAISSSTTPGRWAQRLRSCGFDTAITGWSRIGSPRSS